jgi:hypothetical protein
MDGQVADRVQDELSMIVTQFGDWVKGLAQDAGGLKDEQGVQMLESKLRDAGRELVRQLLQNVLQTELDRRREEGRACPHCTARRRHHGVRPRQVLSSVGELTIQGIYWVCASCGDCGHASEKLLGQSMSLLMRGLVCLLGVSLASFDKAQLVSRRVLGVEVDDDRIRRLCLAEGWTAARQQDSPPVPVKEGGELQGSCDGTSVRTRETGWREIKAYRFEHEDGCHGGAYLEKADVFVSRMTEAADRMGASRAGRRLFLSDMAIWITLAVALKLPEWKHIADYWHACQHIHHAGEQVYGKESPKARKWSGYWSRRLRAHGAAAVDDKLRRQAMFYQKPDRQRAVLDLAQFLRKHADQMDYAVYERQDWTISSGRMESFCKQIGQRMKGPGMRWSVHNVTPMASLVSRWSLEPEHCSIFAPNAHAA